MLFEREKYYKYINDLQKNIYIIYIVLGIFGAIMGIVIQRGLIGLVIGTGLGILIAGGQTLRLKIRLQEMKWKIDIYQNIMKNKSNEFDKA